ncbi:MAG: hypothetical protein ABW321_31235 [Polyangiales bacterium]
MRFVDVETAKASTGVRVVLVKGIPSPWSQAAKAIFEIKQIEALGVWLTPGDAAVTGWTGVVNAPVVLYGDEPVRAHWADILALAERLAPTPALVPAALEQRLLAFGLCNEVMGQGGLLWNMRLSLVALSLASGGKQGYTIPVAQYLGGRYGYTESAGRAAPARIVETLQLLAKQLQASGGPYYFGNQLTALDIYAAAALDTLQPLAAEQCPMHPRSRAALEARRDASEPAPESLLAHRDMMHREHMPLPIEC